MRPVCSPLIPLYSPCFIRFVIITQPLFQSLLGLTFAQCFRSLQRFSILSFSLIGGGFVKNFLGRRGVGAYARYSYLYLPIPDSQINPIKFTLPYITQYNKQDKTPLSISKAYNRPIKGRFLEIQLIENQV